jgi:RNA processing factor Prp31
MAELEELKKALGDSMTTYCTHRARTIEEAYNNGGSEKVRDLEEEYSNLKDAYYEITARQLMRNDPRYDSLIKEAIKANKDLQDDIENLKDISKIINAMTSVVNIIGKIIVILGC